MPFQPAALPDPENAFTLTPTPAINLTSADTPAEVVTPA